MWQRFTEKARRVVFFAQEEAGRLGENYVSPEHVLLGLVRDNDSAAAVLLERMGATLEVIRSDIESQAGSGGGALAADVRPSTVAKEVVDRAYEEPRVLNRAYVGTEHLLLGLIRDEEGLAGRLLANVGVDLERTRLEVAALRRPS